MGREWAGRRKGTPHTGSRTEERIRRWSLGRHRQARVNPGPSYESGSGFDEHAPRGAVALRGKSTRRERRPLRPVRPRSADLVAMTSSSCTARNHASVSSGSSSHRSPWNSLTHATVHRPSTSTSRGRRRSRMPSAAAGRVHDLWKPRPVSACAGLGVDESRVVGVPSSPQKGVCHQRRADGRLTDGRLPTGR